ncbi:hypothetical protein [Aureimonas leprariae]|uniref:hypothetical protein n=1 Tax=Plantimonas leprariae TaxID=2615207 RepID=UPI003CCDC309
MRVSGGAPYFETEDGRPWTPVGHNEAVDWIDLAGLFHRRDPGGVDRHLAMLRANGVTSLRLMLEYSQGWHRYFERPAGSPVPAMVRLWDDLFALCERHSIRILLTPFDTFWMGRRFAHHPWSCRQGGPLASLRELLTSPEARRLTKARFEFAIRRWGGSAALFGWDLMNEIHPDLNGGEEAGLADFVHDVATHVRGLEMQLYGRSHPLSVSVFGPHLDGLHGAALADLAFRHPDLDFATTHLYEPGTIDAPKDTVASALAVGRLVTRALGEIRDGRPFLDSESGPIHTFNDRRRTLTEPFDDEYFRHMSWAHLASGGAGSGMRWPYRHPHRLTAGMHDAQKMLARFCGLVDWRRFRRAPLGGRVEVADVGVAAFGCGDEDQAVVWLLQTGPIGKDGRLFPGVASPVRLALRHQRPGRYSVAAFDTKGGATTEFESETAENGILTFRTPPFSTDLALAIRLKR